jgi:hypothetical protein
VPAFKPARMRVDGWRMTARTWLPRVTLVVALAASSVGLGLAQAGPAAAVAVSPTEKSFSTSIDAYPRWERESGCDPVEKKGPKYLRRLLLATYGPMSSNIVRPCTASDSGHEEGRALDWMVNVRVPAQKEMGDALVAWLQAPDGYGNPEAMARRLGISYVIWNNRTWRAYDPARGWTEYNGCLAKKKHKKLWDNSCHRTHVHVSFTWDGANKRTSYYSGYVACPAPLPVTATPSWPPVATDPTVPVVPTPIVPVTGPVVPLVPSRVLGTQLGTGTPAGPCRVHPDVRLDLAVAGQGGVPLDGVAAVVLRVRVVRPDAAFQLRVWPAGSAVPVDPVLTDLAGKVTEVTVPLGAGGQVSLQLTGAMAHLRADVLGYVVQPAQPVVTPPAV